MSSEKLLPAQGSYYRTISDGVVDKAAARATSNGVSITIPIKDPAADAGTQGCCARVGARLYTSARSVFVRDKARMEHMDGVRALAMLWVVAFHVTIALLGLAQPGDIDAFNRFKNKTMGPMRLVMNGELGVSIFFVLSGYLICVTAVSLFSKQQPALIAPFRTFLWRRFLRIWPTLAVAVVAHSVWAYAIDHSDFVLVNFRDQCSVTGIISSLLFFNNFFNGPAGIGGCPVVAWSTAVEMQFYLISALLVWVYVRNRVQGYAAIGAVALVSLCIRAALIYGYHFETRSAYLGSEGDLDYHFIVYQRFYTRANEYCIGLLVALFVRDWPRNGINETVYRTLTSPATMLFAAAATCGLSYIGTLVEIDVPGSNSVMTGLFLVFSHFVFAALVAYWLWVFAMVPTVSTIDAPSLGERVAMRLRSVLSARVLYPISTVSYSAYLFQFIPLYEVLRTATPVEDNFGYFVGVYLYATAVLLVLAFIVYVLVEHPFMNLR
eukprot:m.53253 g.53253  ORF g.53253 m.53253 type:complete len:494 (-) comp6457_c0_seq1:267-1748(-)